MRTFAALFLGFATLSGALAAADTAPALTAISPDTVTVGGAAAPHRFTIFGSGFEGQNHPDLMQYDHFQYRVVPQNGAPSAWNVCSRPACSITGMSGGLRELQLTDSTAYASPGRIEWRYWWGLAMPDVDDPSGGASAHSGYSNVVALRVVSVTPPPAPAPPAPNRIRVANPQTVTFNRSILSVAPQNAFVSGRTYRVTNSSPCRLYADGHGASLERNGTLVYVAPGAIVTVQGSAVPFGQAYLIEISTQSPGGGPLTGFVRTDCLGAP